MSPVTTTNTTAPALPAGLEALMRQLKMPHARALAPELIATARAQRWEPAEVIKALFPSSRGNAKKCLPRLGLNTALHSAAHQFRSVSRYAKSAAKSWTKIPVPTAVTVFPRDLVNAPASSPSGSSMCGTGRSSPLGGHFAAWERPEDYVQVVRTAVALATG